MNEETPVDARHRPTRRLLTSRAAICILALGGGLAFVWSFRSNDPLQFPGLVDLESIDGELWDLQVEPTLGRCHVENVSVATKEQCRLHVEGWPTVVLPNALENEFSGGRQNFPYGPDHLLLIDGDLLSIVDRDGQTVVTRTLQRPRRLERDWIPTSDMALVGQTLRVVLIVAPRNADSSSVVVEYTLPSINDPNPSGPLFPNEVATVNIPIPTRTATFSPDGTAWAARGREAGLIDRHWRESVVCLSDGRQFSLKSPSDSLQYLDQNTLIAQTYDGDQVALVRIDLTVDAPVESPFEQTWTIGPLDDVYSVPSHDGRWILVIVTNDRKFRWQRFSYEAITQDLHLLDGKTGREVAHHEVTNTAWSSGASYPYWRACFGKRNKQLFLGTDNHILTIDIDEWIAQKGP